MSKADGNNTAIDTYFVKRIKVTTPSRLAVEP